MLRLCRIELREANEFIAANHRHHKPVVGHRFTLGACRSDGLLEGVAVVGRPVARMVDQKYVAEVTRLCTLGEKNVCSFLYSACARVADHMGFRKIQTYILESESGASLLAAGWVKEAVTTGGHWTRTDGAKRRSDQPECEKSRWAKLLSSYELSPARW